MQTLKLKKVQLNQIDFDDRSYIFTYESPISPLIHSIKAIGLIHPPILEQKSTDIFRIVSGYKRVLVMKYLKINQFDARIHYSKATQPTSALFLHNLYENIGTRNLNTMEKSIVLFKLVNLFNLSEERVIKEFLPLLDLGENKLVLDRYLKLARLEENLKIALVEDFISVETAIALLERSTIERKSIFELFQQFKLGKNRQKEFLKLLIEISEISSRSIDKVLQDNEIQKVLKNDKITSPRKTEHIKDLLKKMRYPLLVSTEENFQKIKKDLKLPPNIILRPPPFFEGEKYSIEFSFGNQKEYKKLIGILSAIADHNKLVKLESLI